MNTFIKRQLFFLVLLVLYLIIYSIFNIGLYCPFHEITGLYCPGCGLTRMIKSIAYLDFYQAFRYNPLLFICSPFVLFLYINYAYSKIFNKKSYYERIPKVVWYICLIIVLIYWVLRNIIVELGPVVV